jgi:hypothetical protein
LPKPGTQKKFFPKFFDDALFEGAVVTETVSLRCGGGKVVGDGGERCYGEVEERK